MSTLQARHRGHNIPDGVTTFNEIEYDREGGVFLNRTKLILLVVIVFLLTAFSAFVGRYTAERQFRQYINRDSLVKKADYSSIPDSQIPFLAVEPESYKVFLDPKLYTGGDGTVPKHDISYSGRVEVIFRPKTDTSIISLHMGLLQLDGDPALKRRLSMDTPTDQVLKDETSYHLNAEVDKEQETLKVTLAEPLKSGHYYSLFVNFTGIIDKNPGNGGFFKVVFDNKETVKNYWYVATKLAPRKARNLLPCVDNPKHKAIFEMSIVRDKDTSVIFNTKVKDTQPYNNGLFIDHFEKTEMIRPDSLGLFLSNFKSNRIPTDNSVELTVWSPESTDSIEMITDVVPKTLEFMKTYLATNFPTSKLDIVVVPSTVASSAESPGLIVIKDSVLGTLNKLAFIEYQKSVEYLATNVIRQWLMPMRGLDRGSVEDNWLDEAIINFLKIINIDNIKPTWKLGNRFSLETIQQVMFYDSWTNSEQLSNYEKHTELYNYISSGKGTAILQMLNVTFTEDIFKQTLREYVHTEIYKYKDTISLWTLLDDNARNKSIKLPESSAVLQILNTWMQNKNYPLVRLEVDGDDLVLKQFRFEYNEPKLTNDWVIPVILTSGAAYTTTVWLENTPETRVPGYVSASNGSWILANQHRTGYYRVVYEDTLLDKISYEIALQGSAFDEYTVAQLTGDVVEGAFAGVVGFSDALGFLDRVAQHAAASHGVWTAVFRALGRLEALLHDTRHYDSLAAYMHMLIHNANPLFSHTTDSPDKIMGTVATQNFASHVEYSGFVASAKKDFETWENTTTEVNPIVPNNRTSVYCTAMRYATRRDLKFMLKKYTSSEWTPDRKTIAKSFSCSRNPHFLHNVLSADGIQFDDLADIWQSILDNPAAGPYAFNYIRNNWETLYQEYSDGNIGLLSLMLHASVRGLNSLADLEVLQLFYEKYFGNAVENRNPTLMDVLRFEEEVLRQKIEWRDKYESVISGWMSSKVAKIHHQHHIKANAGVNTGDAVDGKKENANASSETVESKPASNGADENKPAADDAIESTPAPGAAEEGKPVSPDGVKKSSDSAPNVAKENQSIPTVDGEKKTTDKGAESPSAAAGGGNTSAVVVPNTEQRDAPAVSTTGGVDQKTPNNV